MKRTTTIVLAAAIALSMTACTALDSILGFNLFAGLAAVNESDITNATTTELKDLSGSPSFYELLVEKPELKDAVLETIDLELYAPGVDDTTSTYQELAFLAATIELQTTPAGELVNNISSAFDSIIAEDDPEIGPLINSILPVAVLGADEMLGPEDKDVFVAMINALDAANDYFILLGESIGTDGTYAEGAVLSAGDVAQSALVAAIVGSVDYATAGYASAGLYLYDLITVDGMTAPVFAMPAFDSGPLGYILLAAGLSNLGTTTP